MHQRRRRWDGRAARPPHPSATSPTGDARSPSFGAATAVTPPARSTPVSRPASTAWCSFLGAASTPRACAEGRDAQGGRSSHPVESLGALWAGGTPTNGGSPSAPNRRSCDSRAHLCPPPPPLRSPPNFPVCHPDYLQGHPLRVAFLPRQSLPPLYAHALVVPGRNTLQKTGKMDPVLAWDDHRCMLRPSLGRR